MASRAAAKRLPLAKNLFFTTARGRVQSGKADIFRSSHIGSLLSSWTDTTRRHARFQTRSSEQQVLARSWSWADDQICDTIRLSVFFFSILKMRPPAPSLSNLGPFNEKQSFQATARNMPISIADGIRIV